MVTKYNRNLSLELKKNALYTGNSLHGETSVAILPFHVKRLSSDYIQAYKIVTNFKART